MAGVGVYSSRSAIMTSTPLAANTSSESNFSTLILCIHCQKSNAVDCDCRSNCAELKVVVVPRFPRVGFVLLNGTPVVRNLIHRPQAVSTRMASPADAPTGYHFVGGIGAAQCALHPRPPWLGQVP